LTNPQLVNVSPPIKIGWFKGSEYRVRDIFLDNHNWDRYWYNNRKGLRDIVIEEVQKMLSCKGDSRGCFICWCDRCKEAHIVPLGCNSRLCSECGKRYTDDWAWRLSRAMFDVPHRHFVMGIPSKLWAVIKEHRELLKVLMGVAIIAINDVLSYCLRKPKIKAGAIIILHPFGRDLEFKPHVHVLVTEGGFDGKRKFYPKYFFPARAMRKTWQYQVLTKLKESLPKTKENSELINDLFKTYDGFYVWLPKESRIKLRREISKYVGRYIRHPAIANSRICRYDGKEVTFWWKDNEGGKHYKTMGVDDFIEAIIQHIPDKQFRMIRYYGAYNRRDKRHYAKALSQSTIIQTKLCDFDKVWRFRCPKCGSRMEIIWYTGSHPPPNVDFGEKIEDWAHI